MIAAALRRLQRFRWLRSTTTRKHGGAFSPPLVAVALISLVLLPTASANVRLCGARLTSTLLALCRNQVCTSALTTFKRTAVTPWLPEGGPLLLHRMTKRGGIATECCEKRCSFTYLKTYCCNM